MGRFMKCSVEMGLDAMIKRFIKIGSGIQKLIGEYTQNTDSMVIS
jgi:hypothetical protein